MRLLAYTRVSTADQAVRGHSMDDQPERLAAYCKAYGYDLVGVITDQVSARKVPLHKRPGGADLLARLARGEADGVIVVKLDRLFRDLRDGLDYFGDVLYRRRRQAQPGKHVVSLSEHIDTSTASGRTMLKFVLLDADSEADRTGERTRHAMQGLRQRGRVYGHVPYGCVAVGGVLDEAQGRVVQQQLYREPVAWAIREKIVAMRHVDGLSLERISLALREMGVAAPNGGSNWPKSTLDELIRKHDSLAHLPLFDANATPSVIAAPETGVSAHVH